MVGAGRTGRVWFVLLAAGLFAAGCTSSDSNDTAADEPETATTTEAQPTTTAEPTTTTEPTTTAEETTTTELTTTSPPLDDPEAQARAEIEQVLISWANFPVDTANGAEGFGLEYTTGLLQQRLTEAAQSLADEGQVQRSEGSDQAAIESIELDLEAGTARADFCQFSDVSLFDAETDELLSQDRALGPAISIAFMELTPDGWLVADFFFTHGLGDDFEPCEIPGFQPPN